MVPKKFAYPPVWRRLTHVLEVDLLIGLPAVRLLKHSPRILEVGSGAANWSWVRMLHPEQLASGVAVDAFSPSFRRPPSGPFWESKIVARAERLPFRDRSFDAVIAFDVLEHLPKEAGHVMLRELKRVCRRRLILLTPNGFLEQMGEDNPWQRHLSGWTVGELEAEGFRVRGVRGFRLLRGPHSRFRGRPAVWYYLVSLATQPWVWWRPSVAFQLLADWTVGDSDR